MTWLELNAAKNTHTYICIYVYIQIHVCVCVYIYIYIHIYIYISHLDLSSVLSKLNVFLKKQFGKYYTTLLEKEMATHSSILAWRIP